MDPVGTVDEIAQRGRLFPTAMIILPAQAGLFRDKVSLAR
jgi:hypothetical protein